MTGPRGDDVERTLKIVGIALGILVTAGTIGGTVSRVVADSVVSPVSVSLTKHLAETKDDADDMKRMESKIDLLLEDCFRRGGCKR